MTNKGVVILLFVFICSISYAQDIKISGYVRNSDKEPLTNVVISSVNNAEKRASTDSKGYYQISVPQGDSIRLTFSNLNYLTIEYVFPPIKQNMEMNIVMLKDVAVSGERKHIVNISVDDFSKRRSYLLDSSIESLVSTYSGVSTTNELSSQYLVRGGSFDENIVYVNGVEIYRPLLVRSGQQEGLSFINPNMVQNVAFSTGGYNAEYGDKMSSVLDITYKRPTLFEGSVSGSLFGGSAYIGNSSNRFSQMTGVRYKTTQALLGTTDTDAEYKPSFTDVQTYMTYQIASGWDVNFLGNYSHNKYQFTPKSRDTKFGTMSMMRQYSVMFDGWENDRFITYTAALSLSGKISDNVKLGLSASTFSSDEQEYYDIQGQYRLTELTIDENGDVTQDNNQLLGIGTYLEHARNRLESNVYSVSHTGEYKLKNNEIKWGIAYQREIITDKLKEWEMRDSAGYSLPYSGTVVNVFSNVKANNEIESNRFSGYLQDRLLMRSDLGLFILNAGLRASYWDFNEEFIVSPRVALHFVPERNENLIFRLATGVYYQAPFYKEFQQVVNTPSKSEVVLNRNIHSPKSIHVVLGSDYDFTVNTSPFRFTTELYYKHLTDIIPYTINNVKIRYSGENEGSGYIAGMDMRLYGEFVKGATSWISLSLMKTKQKVDGYKMPLPTDQQYNISVFFQDYFPGYERLKMNLKGHLSQGLPISAPNKSFEQGYFRSPAYKRVDIGFSWELLGEGYAIRERNSFLRTFRSIWLGLDIFNLFDIKNVNTYYWIADAHNNQYAVPNYLTGRQLNVKFVADF